MKLICLIAVVSLLAFASDAQEKMPTQLRSARSRYDAAVKAAVDPIRVRYLEELNRVRSDAMNQKNLDLANAIDAEITAVSGKAAATPGGIAAALVKATYSWGLTLQSATSTLRFLDDGTYTVNKETMGKWSVVNSSTIRFENGSLLNFSNDLKHTKLPPPRARGRARSCECHSSSGSR